MGWVINSTPRPLYPLYKKLGGPQGGLDGWGISRPPPGLDPWTVQPLASCYTNDDLPAHKFSGWETQSKEVFSGMEPCNLVEIQRRFVGLGYFSLQVHYITARLNDLKFPSPQKKIFIFHGRTTNLKRKKQSYHCTNYLEELRISRKLLAEVNPGNWTQAFCRMALSDKYGSNEKSEIRHGSRRMFTVCT